MKYLKIRDSKKKFLPISLNYIQYYKKTVLEDKPDRIGIEVKELNAKHFFPFGLYKPISSTINFENTNLINDQNE